MIGRLLAACGAVWLAAASFAVAECTPAPQLGEFQAPRDPAAPAQTATGPTGTDGLGRVVAPVMIDGQGPFRFIVDTGANRSVLSQDLLVHLGLTPFGTGEVHSVHGVTIAPLVQVQAIRYGALTLGNPSLPVLDGAVLAGEQGLLGVDGMAGRRLKMDFEHGCIEITPSRGANRLPGWAVVQGELRFGTLMMVHGNINGLHVRMLLDTGSDTSLANEALRTELNAHVRRDRARVDYAIAYNNGRPVVLQNAILIPQMGMGELQVRNVTAYVGDFHIFALWGLLKEPTLLLGMDVLSQARGIAIDYQRHTVSIHLRDPLNFGSRLEN
jgi:predicted aspartyl protease